MPLDRSTVIIALVGVLVLTAAAASISDPVMTGEGSGDGWDYDNGNGADSGERESGGGPDFVDPGAEYVESVSVALCLPFLLKWEVQLLLLAAVFLGGLLLWRKTDLTTAALVISVLSPLGLFLYYGLATSCSIAEEDSEEGLGERLMTGAEEVNESTGGAVETATDPTVILVILAIAGLLAIGLAIRRDDISEAISLESKEKDDETPTDRGQLGRIAGEAAERIEGQSPDADSLENEIYRAWVEMTNQLDMADPETATPGEFATEAIEAGMSPADVHDLTELFESVRYGDQAPTSMREQQAIDILSRIERDYGESK